MVKELQSIEVTERLSPIFEHVSREAGVPFVPAHFFPHWRNLMDLKVARTWENDGCVLGAVFCPDVFNGNQRGLVYFWFALPEARCTGRPARLLEAFEAAARESGCKNISIADHTCSPAHLGGAYVRRGYSVTELSFSKAL